MCSLLFYDFEVFKHDWLVCIGDMKNKKMHTIVNNKEELEKFYNEHKDDIWVGYNSRYYDQYILKAILCDIDPYYVSNQIIDKKVQGWQVSGLFNDINIYNYDCMPNNNFGLKKIEAFMGSSIKESDVPFDIQRKLTDGEIEDVVKYCQHDVRETYKVFRETISTFDNRIAILQEFNLNKSFVSKTDGQITEYLLGAKRISVDDEFDLELSPLLDMGELEYIKEHFVKWCSEVKDYSKFKYSTTIAGIPHTYGFGGIHGAIPNYVGRGKFMMVDVASFYPALKIEHKFHSRAITKMHRYIQFRDDRVALKSISPKRANLRKVPLNGAYGKCKDKNSKLYDPKRANDITINGQLFLTDLIDKLMNHVQIIQSNTDGVMVKIETDEQEQFVKSVAEEWSKRTKFGLDYDYYTNIVQRDVNNYIAWKVDDDGNITKLKQKGMFKKKSPIDNELSIVLDAIIDYFTKGIPVEDTINNCDDLMKFMMVANIGSTYKFQLHNGAILNERIVRCFASKDVKDTSIFKRRKDAKHKYAIEKNAPPKHCFIDNGNIVGKKCPDKLDKQWYILYTKRQIASIINDNVDGLSPKDYDKLLKVNYEKGVGTIKKNPNRLRDIMINQLGCAIDLDKY